MVKTVLNKLIPFVNHPLFFPALMLYYGIFYILFGAKIPEYNGFGTDGYTYATYTRHLLDSPFINTRSVMRILPSLIVRSILELLNLELSDSNIIRTFEFLNLTLLVSAFYFFKKMLVLLKISFKNQMFAHCLLILNFCILKFVFFYPVLTDVSAFFLSTLLLYFFLAKKELGIIITMLLGAFTWPIIFYQGLVMVVFPSANIGFKALNPTVKKVVSISSALYMFLLLLFLIVYKKMDIDQPLELKIDQSLLYFSVFSVLIVYYFLPYFIFNKILFDKQYISKHLFSPRFIMVIAIFILISLSSNYLVGLSSKEVVKIDTQTKSFSDLVLIYVTTNPTYAVVKPFMYLVSATTYFGVTMLLLFFFWKKFTRSVSEFGWGLVLAFGAHLILEITATESRCLINLFPWFVIFLVYALKDMNFRPSFYLLVLLFNFICSKIWLNTSYSDKDFVAITEKSIPFPNQKFYMNIGPWMSEQMYIVQFAVAAAMMLLLFLSLYQVKIESNNKIRLVKKF